MIKLGLFGGMKLTEYYKECLEKGLEYQDFVMKILLEQLGIPICNYSSRKFQYDIGENQQGIEIKFDDKYRKTGNLYIEVAEKTKKENSEYVKSGIFRNDNAWLYLIGDYHLIFIYSKKFLVGYSEKTKIFEINNKTSKGFLLIGDDVEKYCIKKLEI